jgi:sterol desaturase/sphingolipid hydroxylase (fatty acid hydroxylase superfamily)
MGNEFIASMNAWVTANLKFVIQFCTLVTAVLIFNSMERRIPGFRIDKRRDLPLNLISILIVIFAGEYIKQLVNAGYGALNFQKLVAQNPLTALPVWLKMLLAVVLTDFALYWVHRIMHRPILWPTHSFHHSIAEIWWMAGSRTSLTHLLLFTLPQIFIGYYLLRLEPWQLGVTLSFGIVMNLWLHTNVWVNLGFLEWLFITPNYHRIHHVSQGHVNDNLGFVFTVWDRMFGTYADPKAVGRDFPIFAVPVKKKLLRMMIGV